MGDDRIGRTLLGKLRVLRELGSGGAGVVYEVEHLLTRHRRALKVLRPDRANDPDAAARLLREAAVAGRVGSPRLVETYDVGRLEDGSPYVLMERLEGRTLHRRLKQGPLPPAEALRVGLQIAEGLAAAHAAGVVHRDLTPRNVFLVPGTDELGTRVEQVKILDFGLSKNLPGHTDRFGRLTDTGAVVGTPHYLSPEQARAQPVDERTDQYALGLILYECLTGRRAYGGDSLAEILSDIVEGNKQPLGRLVPELDPTVGAAVERALAVDPARRFESVAAFATALRGESGETAPLDLAGYLPTERPPPIEASHEPLAYAGTEAVSSSPSLKTERTDPRGYAQTEAVSSSSGQPPRTRPPVPASAPPSPQRRGLAPVVALVVVAGAVVLAVAFGVTGLVLSKVRDAPAGAAPATSDRSRDVLVLNDLVTRHEYDECLDRGSAMPRSQGVLEMLIACANGAHSRAHIVRYCEELSYIHPTVWEEHAVCSRVSRSIETGR